MKKRVLLISHNYRPEPRGIGNYNDQMISWFVSRGYDCTVFTAYPYYPFWRIQQPYRSRRFWYSTEIESNPQSGGSLKVIRCPIYVPTEPSALKRVLLDLSFLISAFFCALWALPGRKYDFVVSVSPNFLLWMLGVFCKKITKARLVFRVPAGHAEASPVSRSPNRNWLSLLLSKIDRYFLNKADIVCSSSKALVMEIKEKVTNEVFLIPDWTDSQLFYPLENRDDLKKEFGYGSADQIVLFSGATGEKQDLGAIFHAADELRQFKLIKFIICGSGPHMKILQSMARRLNLVNLSFLPAQPVQNLNKLLNLADVHLIIQGDGENDSGLPLGLSNILSTGGLMLISTNTSSSLYRLAKKQNFGILIGAGNHFELNDAIVKAVSEDFGTLKKHARQYAENQPSIDDVMTNFEEILISFEERKGGTKDNLVPFGNISQPPESDLECTTADIDLHAESIEPAEKDF